jgi:hypothetical protein
LKFKPGTTATSFSEARIDSNRAHCTRNRRFDCIRHWTLCPLRQQKQTCQASRLLTERLLGIGDCSAVERDYTLSIHYQAPGEAEEVVEAAFVTYVRFANVGREPIRRADIAAANPLRIAASGGRVLDISLVRQRREVNLVEVAAPEISGNDASARITFDFLDHRDGGVVRVLSTTPKTAVRLVGDIIGMPSGIVRSDEAAGKNIWGKLGFLLWVLGEAGTMAIAATFTRQLAGNCADVLTLAVPAALLFFVAFILPVVAAIAVSGLWPSQRLRKYPEDLALPKWLRSPPHSITLGHAPLAEDSEPEWVFPADFVSTAQSRTTSTFRDGPEQSD